MRASATHSPLSPEHRPERVPLVGTLLDEILEAIDHPLHDLLFGLSFAYRQRWVEVDLVATWRGRELGRRHEGRPGFERERGRPSRHDRAPPEESHVHARSLLQVAEQSDDVVGAQRLGYTADGSTTQHDHIHPESLTCPDDGLVQRPRESFGTCRDGVAAWRWPELSQYQADPPGDAIA